MSSSMFIDVDANNSCLDSYRSWCEWALTMMHNLLYVPIICLSVSHFYTEVHSQKRSLELYPFKSYACVPYLLLKGACVHLHFTYKT